MRTAVEAGSFGTIQGAVSAQGASGPWAYQIAAQGGHTENDRPNNDFDSGNFTARIDRTVTANLDVGGTVRGFQAVYGSPGDRYTNDPDNQETEGNWLGTVFANVRPSEVFQSHIILGGQNRRYVSESPADRGGHQHHGGEEPSWRARLAEHLQRPCPPQSDRRSHRRGEPHAQHRVRRHQRKAEPPGVLRPGRVLAGRHRLPDRGAP